MRNDRQNPNFETAPPRLAGSLAHWGLGLLTVATAVAVGSVSLWLVVPYLGLMAWLLGGSRSSENEARSREGAPSSDVSIASAEESAPVSSDRPEAEGPEASPAASEVSTSTEESGSTRQRRGRGRGRSKASKPVAPPAEPVSVSWVQVGPGQFVRVEGPSSSSEGSLDVSLESVARTEPTGSESVDGPERGPDQPAENTSLADVSVLLDPSFDSEGSDVEPDGWVPSEPLEDLVNQVDLPEPPAFEPMSPEELAPGAEMPPIEDDPEPREPEPASEPEIPGVHTDEGLLESEWNGPQDTLDGPEVGEGDLPQAGAFEDPSEEVAGADAFETSEPESEHGPEFDGESRTSFGPNLSHSPTVTRVPTWPAWLPRTPAVPARMNVRNSVSRVSRPSRVRSEPRAAQGRRRSRSWHGVLRLEPRAPPDSRTRRPTCVRRSVRSIRPPGEMISQAVQAA